MAESADEFIADVRVAAVFKEHEGSFLVGMSRLGAQSAVDDNCPR